MNAYLAARNLKNGVYTIYAEYSSYPKVKRVPTGVKVHQKYWDNATKKVKANGAADVKKTNDDLTAVLNNLNETVKHLYRVNGNVMPTVEQLNAHYNAASETLAAVAAERPLTEVLKDFIDSKTDWAEATRKGFNTLGNNIQAFQEATKTKWFLSTLTNDMITAWQHWLLKQYDYNNATLGKRVRLLRQLLLDQQPPNVNLSKVTPLYSQMLLPPVVLNQQEIEALRTLNLHFSPKLERVRDLMIAQIFTGLRFSDLTRLQKHHIQKDYVVISMQKTQQTVRIPVFPAFSAIVSKYTNSENGQLEMPKLSNQKFNEYIKELCQHIPALRKEIHIEFKKRKTTHNKKIAKWELITSHSSRRSFCSLCLDLGYSVKEVMQWSGHRTMAAFSRYIGLSDVSTTAAADFAARYEARLQAQ
ncbi:site-specific integrase [Hymenobacter coalescens]